MNDMEDKIAQETTKPDIKLLLDEWTTATNRNTYGDRREAAENTRWAYWEGQDDSGKKLDAKLGENGPAFPWDGASDTRIRLADEVCNWERDILEAAFSRASFTANPIEVSDLKTAGYVQKRLAWARKTGLPKLSTEVELAAQYRATYGWSVIQTLWERRVTRQNVDITLEELQQLAEQAPEDSQMRKFPEMILDSAQEDQAIAVLQDLYRVFTESQDSTLHDVEIPELKKKRARKAVRELRNDGTTALPIARVSVNLPCIVALKPFEEVFFADETTDIQRARVIFRREYLSEQELMSKGLADGWDEAWIKEVVQNTKGQQSTIAEEIDAITPLTENLDQTTTKKNLCEVIWAYRRTVDEDGVESVWFTVFSPHLKGDTGEKYAIHQMLDYGKPDYPFVSMQRERTTRRIYDSRGIPELCMTWQGEKKAQRDSCFDRTSITLVPPLMVSTRNLGKQYRISPAGKIARDRPGEVEWMTPPDGKMSESLALVGGIDLEVNRYFGRPAEGIDPVESQIRQQACVNRWLEGWKLVFAQVDALCSRYLEDEEWERISGQPAQARGDAREAAKYDWDLAFDVRDLSPEVMTAKLQAITDYAVSADVSGVVDRSKLTGLVLNAIDPTVAAAVLTDTGNASKRMWEDVRNEIAQMSLGNEAQYVEEDPAAKMKMQMSEQIIQKNPKYQKQMQEDKQFSELMEKWNQNLGMSIQQQQNAQIGRIGVKPE